MRHTSVLDVPEFLSEDETPNTMEVKGLLSHLAACLSYLEAHVY